MLFFSVFLIDAFLCIDCVLHSSECLMLAFFRVSNWVCNMSVLYHDLYLVRWFAFFSFLLLYWHLFIYNYKMNMNTNQNQKGEKNYHWHTENICSQRREKFIDNQSMGQASKMNDLCNFMNAIRVNVRNEFCLYNF